MKKQKILQIAFFFSVCIIASCGNLFQPSTNLGQQIANDVDPNLIDINRNIKPFSDSLASLPSSMRDVGDTFPSGYQWNPWYLIAGTNIGLDSGTIDSVYAYLEFRPLTCRVTASIYNALRVAHIDSVVLMLRRLRVDTRSALVPKTVTKIDVRGCPILGDSSTDLIPFTKDLWKNTKALGTLSINTDTSVHDSTLGGDTAFSIRLDSSYVTRFKNAVKDSGFDTSAFAFCLGPNGKGDGLGRFMNVPGEATSPRIVAYYHASDADTALRTQTLYRDHASFTAIERDSGAACKSPISTLETIRRAVFNIDVSSLSNFMDTAGPDDKKYVVIQKAEVTIPVSQCISDMRLDSIYVQYKLLDSDSLAISKKSFAEDGHFYIKNTKDTSYAISIAKRLQPLVLNHRSKSVNLFLMVPSQNSPTGYGPPFIQVAWKPDSKLKLIAIVTNPR